MRLLSFVLNRARETIKKHGKLVLMDPRVRLAIVAEALEDMDIVTDQHLKAKRDYVANALKHPEYIDVCDNILFLYQNYSVKKFASRDQLEEIFANSIKTFKLLFEDLSDQLDYKINEELVSQHNDIIEDIETRFITESEGDNRTYTKKERNKLYRAMEKGDIHFYIEFRDKIKVFPVVVDLLLDTFTLEYSWTIDDDIIKHNLTIWDTFKSSHSKSRKLEYTFYEKIDFIKIIRYDRLRMFILAEYARTLNIEHKAFRKFMQHILYANLVGSKNSPKDLDLDKIGIGKRIFLMETTKLVVG
jgi:hypothetical protein